MRIAVSVAVAAVLSGMLQSCAAVEVKEEMHMAQAEPESAISWEMERKMLASCSDYFEREMKKAGRDPYADRFQRQQYMEYCLENMKEKAERMRKKAKSK